MRWIRFAVLILVVTVLQASLADVIAVTRLNIKPDFLLILVVFFAINYSGSEAIISSFTIGFAADIIGSTMGVRMISFGLFGTLLAYLHSVIAIKRMSYQSVAIFITGFLTGVLAYFLTRFRGEQGESDIYAVIFWTSLYSSVVGPFLFLPTAWWMRIKTHRFGQH